MSLFNFLLLLTVFLTPLIGVSNYFGFQQAVTFGYEQTKVVFFIFINTIAGFFWMLSKPKIKWTNIKIASSVFILYLLLTSLIGINPQVSILGTQPYFQGLLLYSQLYLFSLMVSTLNLDLKIYAKAFLLSAALVGIAAIKDWINLEYFDLQIPTYAGRVVSTFGQPNFYAGFLLFTIPFIYYLMVKGFNFWITLSSLLIVILGIIASGSRSAILLLIFVALIWLMTQFKRFWLIFSLITLIFITTTILISITFGSGILWQEIFGLSLLDNPDLTRHSVEKRPYIYSTGLSVFLEKPSTGYGLETISQAYSGYFESNKHKLFEENLNISPVLISLKDLTIDRTHNYILDLALFSGVLGVAVWLILIILLFKKILGSKVSLEKSVLLVSLITYLIWIQFQNQSIIQLIYFYFLLGAIDKD